MTVESANAVRSSLTPIEDHLSYQFKDKTLLAAALTHPSLIAESKSHNVDNQRLEYLGDAVLQLALTEVLYLRFPDEGEGPLTKWRARLVSKPALAAFGEQLNLGAEMLMGKGEEANGGRSRSSNLADCVEAVLGAVYLDGGFNEAQKVVLKMVGSALDEVTQSDETGNPKGDLQEALQALFSDNPIYSILSATGPDHDKKFVASVTWRGDVLGQGEGASKKTAEAAAAADALVQGKWRAGDGV
ncbi:MAG: ribonuclease III [Roseibacillus sp.]